MLRRLRGPGTRRYEVRIVIVGGGPAGYESALVARQLGADVTVVDSDGLGGACVLTDCVPSKTLIATSDAMTDLSLAGSLGVRFQKGDHWDDDDRDTPREAVWVDPPTVFGRVKTLALAQSLDIATRLAREGINVVQGAGRLVDPRHVAVRRVNSDEDDVLDADVIL